MSRRGWVLGLLGALTLAAAVESREPDKVTLLGKDSRTAAPAANPKLPDGLTWQWTARPQVLENRASGRFDWDLKLAGNARALRPVRRVVYTMPRALFSFGTFEARRETGFMIDGDCPDVAWEIKARLHMGGGKTIDHTLPFPRPEVGGTR